MDLFTMEKISKMFCPSQSIWLNDNSFISTFKPERSKLHSKIAEHLPVYSNCRIVGTYSVAVPTVLLNDFPKMGHSRQLLSLHFCPFNS